MKLTALLLVSTLIGCSSSDHHGETLKFWALGREGEVVAQMIPEFERRNPGIHVELQQMPFTAAHEKLLTAYVGDATPDLAQVGNTWIPEFAAINAIDDLTPDVARSRTVDRSDYFAGIWSTNLIGDRVYGIPWYVDTRLLFYRNDLLARAGFPSAPRTWSEWTRAMEALKRNGHYAILLPTNEYTAPVVLALQRGSTLLREDGRFGDFRDQRFQTALDFYLNAFHRGYAPVVSNSEVANRYQQFAEGEFAMYISGPWDVAEFRTRLGAGMDGKWATAPLPAPDGMPWPGVSLAGGSSLVVFRASQHKSAAWKLIEYLSEPAQQVRFFELMRDLPARKSAWKAPAITSDKQLEAFRVQLEHVVPTPQVPEWEQIATAIYEEAEAGIRGRSTSAEVATRIDAAADRILEKRRWMMAKDKSPLHVAEHSDVRHCSHQGQL